MGDSDSDSDSDSSLEQLESLQVLAARVVQQLLSDSKNKIIEEETDVYELRLKALEEERDAMIKQRSDELSRSREATHLKEIWEFCNKCDSCFESDEAASCSVAGCQMYRTCHCDLDDTIEDYFYDNFRDKNGIEEETAAGYAGPSFVSIISASTTRRAERR